MISTSNEHPAAGLDTPVLGTEWASHVRTHPRRVALIAGLALVVGLGGSFGLARYQQADVRAQATTRLLVVSANGGDENVKLGTPFSVTVSVKANNVVDTTYVGTVHFSSSDDSGANLPTDYTFTEADAGTHNFDQAVSFSQAGSRTLDVTDTADSNLTASLTFVVTEAGSGTVPGDLSGTKPVITQPADGATINQTSTTIIGTAAPSATVVITDNDSLIGTVTADSSGAFVLDVTDLAPDMPHVFVATVDSVASDRVQVMVQTTATLRAPELVLSNETVTIDPMNPAPMIDALVTADAQLRSVRLQVDQRTVDLIEAVDAPGTYRGSFLSPTIAGEFPVDVLVDSPLSTTPQTYSGLRTISVAVVGTQPLPTDTNPPTTNTPPTVAFTFEPTTGKIPLTVQFTSSVFDAEDGVPQTYLWDFGDGTTSTEPNPTHVYKVNGPYTPKLTVTDSAGESAAAQASTSITATGPAGIILGLLLLSSGIGYFVTRPRRKEQAA